MVRLTMKVYYKGGVRGGGWEEEGGGREERVGRVTCRCRSSKKGERGVRGREVGFERRGGGRGGRGQTGDREGGLTCGCMWRAPSRALLEQQGVPVTLTQTTHPTSWRGGGIIRGPEMWCQRWCKLCVSYDERCDERSGGRSGESCDES